MGNARAAKVANVAAHVFYFWFFPLAAIGAKRDGGFLPQNLPHCSLTPSCWTRKSSINAVADPIWLTLGKKIDSPRCKYPRLWSKRTSQSGLRLRTRVATHPTFAITLVPETGDPRAVLCIEIIEEMQQTTSHCTFCIVPQHAAAG